jgi:hypothetical protein
MMVATDQRQEIWKLIKAARDRAWRGLNIMDDVVEEEGNPRDPEYALEIICESVRSKMKQALKLIGKFPKPEKEGE